MKKYKILLLVIIVSNFIIAFTSTSEKSIWQFQRTNSTASLRGLSVVNDSIVWVSGKYGTVLKTLNGGKSWESFSVNMNCDFRDIEAFNEHDAIIMSAGIPCRIYKTEDGGENWELTYLNSDTLMFLDGMAFHDKKTGFCYGDPINGKFVIIKTIDAGKSWNQISPVNIPLSLENEASFAASGSAICISGNSIFIGTGGTTISRLLVSRDLGLSWQFKDTPMRIGGGSGIFSIAFNENSQGVIVGGSYLDSTSVQSNCLITNDLGKSWSIPNTNPKGYRSCVAQFKNKNAYLAVGTTGTDISMDGGINWKQIDKTGFNSCAVSDNYCWAIGREGRIGKFEKSMAFKMW